MKITLYPETRSRGAAQEDDVEEGVALTRQVSGRDGMRARALSGPEAHATPEHRHEHSATADTAEAAAATATAPARPSIVRQVSSSVLCEFRLLVP